MTTFNTLRKLMPISLRSVFHPVRYSITTPKNMRTFPRDSLLIAVGFAFVWPLKKEKDKNAEDSSSNNNDISQRVQIADDLFDSGKYEECYNFLMGLEDKHIEVSWRLCRAMYNMSKDSKYKKEQKRDLIIQAYQIISEKLQDNFDNFAVQKWYAILLDTKSNYDGMKERIKQLQNVKKHMDIAVTLNPNDATTLYMLGEWCYQISELPWHHRKIAEALFATPPHSTYEDALEYFLRAESVQPRFYSLNLLRLGNCYLKLNKEDQAKYYLKLAASYPAKSNDDHLANTEATELLKKLS